MTPDLPPGWRFGPLLNTPPPVACYDHQLLPLHVQVLVTDDAAARTGESTTGLTCKVCGAAEALIHPFPFARPLLTDVMATWATSHGCTELARAWVALARTAGVATREVFTVAALQHVAQTAMNTRVLVPPDIPTPAQQTHLREQQRRASNAHRN